MKAKGVSAKEGDMIPFMFCTPEDPTVKGGKASNAYHKDDVRRNGSTLKVGVYPSLSSTTLC
jgi:DNA polymerase alpha subunit A